MKKVFLITLLVLLSCHPSHINVLLYLNNSKIFEDFKKGADLLLEALARPEAAAAFISSIMLFTGTP